MMECPECGGRLGLLNGYYKCRDCDFEIPEEEMMVASVFGDDEPAEMSEACAACGGDFPNCMDSCPLYD